MDVGPKLREALFDPLKKVLGDRKRLILAPDGDIYRLPFGVLPDGQRALHYRRLPYQLCRRRAGHPAFWHGF